VSDGRIALSLFTGAGGLDLGTEAADFKTVHAIESDPTAVETLNANRDRWYPALDEVEPADITTLKPKDLMRRVGLGRGELDLLIGGPPCVAFSKSGFHLEYKREGRDERAGLLGDYLRFLEALRPKAYVIENVYGLAYRNQSAAFFNSLKDGLSALGYSVTYGILNAADYGVPQNRQRLFIVGRRDGRQLELPTPTHWGAHERRRPPADVETLKPHVTAREALAGLRTRPEPEESVNGKYGHLLSEIPPGSNYLHYTAKAGHPKPLFGWRSRYWTFLLKLDPDRAASTIQAQPGPYVGPFHWRNRRLRRCELARLQGFPDDYTIAGNRKQVQSQIGNSVPPLLARRVAAVVREQLDAA
jgi:DNA (cytosine-5)-methyltransferase 1